MITTTTKLLECSSSHPIPSGPFLVTPAPLALASDKRSDFCPYSFGFSRVSSNWNHAVCSLSTFWGQSQQNSLTDGMWGVGEGRGIEWFQFLAYETGEQAMTFAGAGDCAGGRALSGKIDFLVWDLRWLAWCFQDQAFPWHCPSPFGELSPGPEPLGTSLLELPSNLTFLSLPLVQPPPPIHSAHFWTPCLLSENHQSEYDF